MERQSEYEENARRIADQAGPTKVSQYQRSLASIINSARKQCEMEARKGAEWAFFRLTKAEREMFDTWLVSINHVLAFEAGTTERRFTAFMDDLVTGRYKGEMP